MVTFGCAAAVRPAQTEVMGKPPQSVIAPMDVDTRNQIVM